MLLLGRRAGEEIVLPSCGVTITVVAIKGKSVRLGFSAPPDVRVTRRELLAAAACEGEDDTRVLRNAEE